MASSTRIPTPAFKAPLTLLQKGGTVFLPTGTYALTKDQAATKPALFGVTG